MLSENVVISAKDLTKTYRLFGHPGDRIKQFLSLGLRKYHRSFTALDNVSFEIRRGETVGIIGSNGSGKSTLLQLICGILKPTSGKVLVNGRIAALLELGAGFNPEFTGRENVYFQGALMGFTNAQIDARFDDIATFADIGEFIDQPVRTYSSGMFVRLAFSVATHVDPDILVLDEALAVGDTRFQQRCFERISEIRNRGCTILIVTHALEQVAHFCDRALLLNHGTLLADGKTASALSSYLSILNAAPEQKMAPKSVTQTINDCFSSHPAYNPGENRWGDHAATITDIVITQNGKKNPETIAPGHIVELRLKIDFHADIQRPIYGLAIKSPMGVLVLNTNSRYLLAANDAPDQNAGDTVFVSFIFDAFLDCGKYLLSFGIASESTGGVVPRDRRYDAISIEVAHPHSSTGATALNPRFALTMTP